MKKLKINLIS